MAHRSRSRIRSSGGVPTRIPACFALALASPFALAAPQVAPGFSPMFNLSQASPSAAATNVTQIAFGPDGRLYAARATAPMLSFAVDASGQLSDPQPTGIGPALGLAFATHSTPDDPTPRTYLYASRQATNFDASLSRYANPNSDTTWGGSGEVNVDLVQNVPIGDHAMNQIAIRGNQLFVGVGIRTSNGQAGPDTAGVYRDEPTGPVSGGGFFNFQGTGFSYGETSYGGTITTITNLASVPSVTSAAQLRNGPNGTSGPLLGGRDAFLLTNPTTGQPNPTALIPLTSTAQDKLIVHSAATRNPFGIAAGPDGEIYFTNNFGRASSTGPNGTYASHFRDRTDSNLANDIHDQFFRATPDANYGYVIAGLPSSISTVPQQLSITPDALFSNRPGYNTLHNSAAPVGLGPSSSSNGLEVFTADLSLAAAAGVPSGQRLWALITRWNGSVSESSPGTDTISYADIVLVDISTGSAWRVASGFSNPIDIAYDGRLGFYVAEYGTGTIYRTGLFPVIPEPAAATFALAGLPLLRRPRRM